MTPQIETDNTKGIPMLAMEFPIDFHVPTTAVYKVLRIFFIACYG
jgi:hypothetical protein